MLTNRASKTMHMRLQLDTARLTTCHTLMDEIQCFALAVVSVQNPDAAMVLDAVERASMGLAKAMCTDSFGKNKAPLKGNSKDGRGKHNEVRKVGPCHRCGGKGHLMVDCMSITPASTPKILRRALDNTGSGKLHRQRAHETLWCSLGFSGAQWSSLGAGDTFRQAAPTEVIWSPRESQKHWKTFGK